MVWCGSWCLVWSVVGIWDSSDCLVWWSDLGRILWSYGMICCLLSGLTAEIKIKKMRSWGISSEKAVNALGSYVKKKRRKNTEILYFSNHIRWKSRFDCKCLFGFYQGNWPFAASHSRGTKPPCWRANVVLGQDKQRKLPFKIMYVFLFVCLVPVRLLLSSLAVQLYHVNGYLAEIWPNIMKTIWLRRKLITILQLYGNLTRL